MKKIVASVGLVALGASAMQASAQDMSGGPDTSKPWSVSATLRGFYDDNTGTVPNDVQVAHRGSAGWEVSPSANLNWSLEQTTISLGYLYSLKYYQNTPPTSADHSDSVHTFNASLNHAFSERYQATVRDSFVIGQEPDLLRAGNTFATFQRISGDNIRNYGSLGLSAELTPELGADIGYDNTFFKYDATGVAFVGTNVVASPAGLLNRIENGVHLEGLWTLQPETKAILGYRFHDVGYTGDEDVAGNVALNGAGLPVIANAVRSNDRNVREHTGYVGAQHNFRPDLSGDLRVGASYNNYYNTSLSGQYSPYVTTTLKYTYAPESFIQGGFTYDRSPSDVIAFSNGSFVTDAESAVVFATVNHRITPKIYGSVTGQFQNSTLNGGAVDGESEQYYLVGLNLEYRFTSNFSAHVGYNYDKLSSFTATRTFDRNRVYMGVTASY